MKQSCMLIYYLLLNSILYLYHLIFNITMKIIKTPDASISSFITQAKLGLIHFNIIIILS